MSLRLYLPVRQADIECTEFERRVHPVCTAATRQKIGRIHSRYMIDAETICPHCSLVMYDTTTAAAGQEIRRVYGRYMIDAETISLAFYSAFSSM